MLLVVRRPITILLLLLVTAGIAGATLYMSGKSYSKVDPVPFEDIRHLAKRIEHRPASTRVIALIVMPIVANFLMFVPWGFLLFVALNTEERPTVQAYVLTILLGLSFTATIEAWQYFLPDRVADVNDVIWNTIGASAGAVLAHVRSRFRFEFQ